jgi:hypothetical protein
LRVCIRTARDKRRRQPQLLRRQRGIDVSYETVRRWVLKFGPVVARRLGPIRYIDDDDNTVGFLDWQGVLKAAEEGRAKIAL